MDIEVDRSELSRVRAVELPSRPLEIGEVRLSVDAFGLSANNISYAVFGDALRYWDFFPAADDELGWGRIPVWGFGDVVESRASELNVGERLFGYFPMSSELVIVPGRSDDRRVVDVVAHRAAMAVEYSSYTRCVSDPVYRVDREREQMLLFPLFFTSFVIDDFLVDRADFEADQLVVSSASSKTAIGVAYLSRARGKRVVGLTSAANAEFVKDLDVYDRVLTYDDVAAIQTESSVLVDIAGDLDVVRAVHSHLVGLVRHSMIVGGTHWDHQSETTMADVPSPERQFFFAPTQISKRTKEWGRDGLDQRLGAAWDGFANWVSTWIEFRSVRGTSAVSETYLQLLGGRVDPSLGFICSFGSDGADQ